MSPYLYVLSFAAVWTLTCIVLEWSMTRKWLFRKDYVGPLAWPVFLLILPFVVLYAVIRERTKGED